MTLALLPTDPLEVIHFRCDDRSSDELQPIQLGLVRAVLVVLDEQLDVLHILELDKSQVHKVLTIQVLWFQAEMNEMWLIREDTQ